MEVRTELKEAVSSWWDLGLALGLLQHTLKSIQMQYRDDVGQCLTETLAAWLHGRDSATVPCWRAMAEALLSISYLKKLAVRIADSHGMSGSSSSTIVDVESSLAGVDDVVLGKLYGCHDNNYVMPKIYVIIMASNVHVNSFLYALFLR